MYRIALRFSLINCSCGADRVRGVTCPDCGARPFEWEVDQHLLRRKRLVEEARLALQQPPPDSDARQLDLFEEELFDQLGAWFAEFAAALEGIDDARDVDVLRTSIAAFVELRARFDGRSLTTRPMGAARSEARRIFRAGGALVEKYLVALEARTPLQAQRHGEAAQHMLNEMGEAASLIARDLEKAGQLIAAGSSSESMGALLELSLTNAGATDLIALEGWGAAHLKELAPQVKEFPSPGLGCQVAINLAYADLILDGARFRRLVADLVDLFLRHPDRVRQLSNSPAFMRDLKSARIELFDAAASLQRNLSGDSVPRQAARVLLDLQNSLVEGPGHVVSSALLVVSGVKSRAYERLREDNATDLVRRAQSEPLLAEGLSGLDDHLRTAYAHRSVIYGVDGITTDLKAGSRHYSLDDVLDLCLLGVESTLACLLAITVTLASIGVAEDDPTLTDLGLSATDTAGLMLAAFGYQHDSIRIFDATLEVNITSRRSDVAITTVLGGVLATQPDLEAIERFSVTLPGSDVPWTCDAKAFQEFRLADDEFEKQLALIRIQSGWRHAGRRHLTPEALRKWTVVNAIDALDLSPRDGLRRVRQLRDLAQDQQDTELEAVLRRLTRHARLRLMGEEDQIGPDVLAVLTQWNTDTPFDMI